MILKAFFFSKRFTIFFQKKNKKTSKKEYLFEEKEKKKRSGKNLVFFFSKKKNKVKEMIFPRSSEKHFFFVSRLVLRLLVWSFLVFFGVWALLLFFFHLMFRNLSFFCNFWSVFSLFISSLFFFGQLFFLSFNLFWCLVSKTTCSPRKNEVFFFFLKTPGIAKKEIWMFFWVFLYCPFSNEETRFFSKQTKVNKQILFQTFNTIFSQKMIMQKMMKEQFLKFPKTKKNFRETVLVILEENVFCS